MANHQTIGSGKGTQLMVKFLELFNARESDRFHEVVAADYKQHVAFLPGGVEGAKKAVQYLWTAFPDIQGTLELAAEEGDLVVGLFRWRGTHRGPFAGLEPSGAKVEWVSSDWWRFTDRITEHWDTFDALAIVEQVRAASGLPPVLQKPKVV
jgi:predicted ester cyclase